MTAFPQLVQDPGERHLIIGSSRCGKSSLEDMSMRHIQASRPECMQLVADTKPRFRAETIAYGPRGMYRRSAEKLYRGWAKGPIVPNSVAVDLNADHPFRGLWDLKRRPGEIVIMQSNDPLQWKRMLELMKAFTMKQTPRERLLIVDEGMDFYQRNSLGIDARNDVILQAARAGGERAIGLMFCAHRPFGIPPLLVTLTSRLSLFHMRFERDMAYLYGMGVPENTRPPGGNYEFDQYVIQPGGQIGMNDKPFRLTLPDWYLDQLSDT